MKPIQVQVTKYESDYGEVFNTKDECIHHELMRSGIRKTCPSCYGSKKVDPYGDGRVSMTCSTCSGKGWVERKIVYE